MGRPSAPPPPPPPPPAPGAQLRAVRRSHDHAALHELKQVLIASSSFWELAMAWLWHTVFECETHGDCEDSGWCNKRWPPAPQGGRKPLGLPKPASKPAPKHASRPASGRMNPVELQNALKVGGHTVVSGGSRQGHASCLASGGRRPVAAVNDCRSFALLPEAGPRKRPHLLLAGGPGWPEEDCISGSGPAACSGGKGGLCAPLGRAPQAAIT